MGKRTAARILAEALLCRDRGCGTESCGRCPSCLKVRAQTHADLTWIGPEGRNLKVSEIRAAEQRLRLRPLEGSRKVLVLERAHTMTPEAQNALLKTLEEPPGDATLILTTSRPNVLLPTVRSRCQRVPFAPMDTEAVVSLLREDGLGADEAQVVAALAHGSVGRARELDVDALLQVRDTAAELDFLLCPGAPASACLEAAQEMASDRAELMSLLDQLLIWVRDQILMATDARAPLANADRSQDVEDAAAERSIPLLLRRAEAILEARRQLELPFNLNATLIAEQLCLALAGHGRMIAVEV